MSSEFECEVKLINMQWKVRSSHTRWMSWWTVLPCDMFGWWWFLPVCRPGEPVPGSDWLLPFVWFHEKSSDNTYKGKTKEDVWYRNPLNTNSLLILLIHQKYFTAQHRRTSVMWCDILQRKQDDIRGYSPNETSQFGKKSSTSSRI